MKDLFLVSGPDQLSRYRSSVRNGLVTADLNAPVEDKNGLDKALLEKQYLELISSFSAKTDSPFWWAGSVSEKSTFSSQLFVRIYKMQYLDGLIKRSGDADIAVICSDKALRSQIRNNYAAHFDIRCSRIGIIHDGICDAVGICAGVLKQIARALYEYGLLLYVRMVMRTKRRSIDKKSIYVVIRTWADHRSYKTGSYQDPYFNRLLAHVSASGRKVLIFAGILSGFKGLVRLFEKDRVNLIVPTDFYLRGADVLKCLFVSLFLRPRIKNEIIFNGRPLNHLVLHELRQDITTTRFFGAVLQYYSCKRLAAAIPIERFIYTFENYAWEKMSMLGLRSCGPKIKIAGFQHAFVPKNNFAYFPGPSERKTMPLPDKIITMGSRTRDIMKRIGDYPADIFDTGCALRQEYLFSLGELPRETDGDIFVPLTITIEDTVKAFQFIFRSGLAESRKKIYFRLHPATPRDEVMKGIGFSLPDNFIISDNPPIVKEIERCCIVLYTWTTVCIEALKMGRPVVYMDINYPLEVDPLFECSFLKRTASTPEQLLPVISELCGMDDPHFRDELKKAQEYVKEYFYPVNKEGLDAFLK
ncbi:MAG: hypothetical protein WC779_00300 [Candidatus Omnitrophota bacterium]|jgi:hypothetical protein